MYEFMQDAEAKSLFAEIDYYLRTGTHIQHQYRGQEESFRFIERHFSSLQSYYADFFGLILCSGGEGERRYFFLDADGDRKNRVPNSLREYLDADLLLIGLFLCKLRYVDFSEVETITDFSRALREEYEPYKADFYRLLTRGNSNKQTASDDLTVDKRIVRAFHKFHHLGWVRLEGDRFRVMPSLERLRLLYIHEIDRIDELIAGDEYDK